MMIKREEVLKILSNIGFTFFKVTFVKKNGEVRDLVGRMGVKKYLKNGGNNNLKKGLKIVKDNYIIIFDIVKKDYRMVNINNVVSIKANNYNYN